MSVPEPSKLRIERSEGDLVEVTARRGRGRDVIYAGRARDLHLPGFGAATWSDTYVAACTRPERWWILAPVRPPNESAARIAGLLGTGAIVVDQSSGYVVFDLVGAGWRVLLTRGCRLDLDPGVFAPGHAAATTLAQVHVVLIPHPSGILVLAPSTYAQHFREWLEHLAKAHP